jgi:hypothetical protein
MPSLPARITRIECRHQTTPLTIVRPERGQRASYQAILSPQCLSKRPRPVDLVKVVRDYAKTETSLCDLRSLKINPRFVEAYSNRRSTLDNREDVAATIADCNRNKMFLLTPWFGGTKTTRRIIRSPLPHRLIPIRRCEDGRNAR